MSHSNELQSQSKSEPEQVPDSYSAKSTPRIICRPRSGSAHSSPAGRRESSNSSYKTDSTPTQSPRVRSREVKSARGPYRETPSRMRASNGRGFINGSLQVLKKSFDSGDSQRFSISYRIESETISRKTLGFNPLPGQNMAIVKASKSFETIGTGNNCNEKKRPMPKLGMPQPGFPPMIGMDMTDLLAKPGVMIYPSKVINFSYEFVQMNILILNIPEGIIVTPSMIECFVVTSSGSIIPVVFKQEPTQHLYLTTFHFGFKAGPEVGLHNVRARLHLPFISMDKSTMDLMAYGVCGDQHDVLISRNYFKDSFVETFTCNLLDAWGTCYINVSEPRYRTWGVTSDIRSNRVYCSDRIGSSVVCVGPSGDFLFRFQQFIPESRLNQPMGLSFDTITDRVYVCDKNNNRIAVFAGMGEYLFSFGRLGKGPGEFVRPWDVSVNPATNLLAVTDSTNRIQIFDSNGRFLVKYEIHGCEPKTCEDSGDDLDFDSPRNVAYDHSGLVLFVTDVPTGSIYKLATHTGVMLKLVQQDISPQGLIVDHLGNLLVADPAQSAVLHIGGDDGVFLCRLRGVGSFMFHVPVNLTILRNGTIGIMEGSGKFCTI